MYKKGFDTLKAAEPTRGNTVLIFPVTELAQVVLGSLLRVLGVYSSEQWKPGAWGLRKEKNKKAAPEIQKLAWCSQLDHVILLLDINNFTRYQL